MSALEQQLADYLAVRRALGYKLERTGKLLAQFVSYLDATDADTITTQRALAWATLPPGSQSNWPAQRLSAIRGFAAHVHSIDPACEVPPADLLARRPRRTTPYLYSDEQIAALIAAAATLATAHRTATLRTLIGLLSVTGMRVGEAIGLDRGDVHFEYGALVVRNSKFGKSRELPLHPSTVDALRRYLRRRDRPRPAQPTPALLVSAAGTRLVYCNVHYAFGLIVARAGLQPRSASCRPRLHDLRHSFAVRTVLDAYGAGADVQARLPLLSTYLGHINPSATYWYLQAAPELLALAGERLEHHLDSRPR